MPSEDMQNLIARLQMQQANAGAPSFAGIAAPTDPAATQNILQQIQQQGAVDDAGTEPGGGQFNFLLNAGKKDFQRAANQFGNAAQQGSNMLGAPNPQAAASQQAQLQRNAVIGAKTVEQAALAQGADPLQAQMAGLQVLGKAGIDVTKQMSDLQEAQQKQATAKLGMTNVQGEIDNREQQRADAQTKEGREKAQNTWTTLSQTPGGAYIQKNGLGEVKVVQTQNASQQAAATVSPDAMQAMLDSYHTTGTPPAGMARSPALAGKFWQAEADYQAKTGNTAASVLAQKEGAKADGQALAQTSKQLAATTSYISTFDKNIEKARQLGNGLDFSDMTKFNQARQAWLKGTSDPQFAKYNLFFNAAASEFAKIQSGSLGNAPVSDAARAHADEVMQQTIGSGGMNALFDAMKEESTNRLDSLKATQSDLVTKLKQGPNAPQTPPPAAAPAVKPLIYDPASGTFK